MAAAFVGPRSHTLPKQGKQVSCEHVTRYMICSPVSTTYLRHHHHHLHLVVVVAVIVLVLVLIIIVLTLVLVAFRVLVP